MKRKIAGSFPVAVGLLALAMVLAGVSAGSAAPMSYTVNATSPQTTYVAGVSNTFDFAVTITTDGTIEWCDGIRFDFPAGVTVTAGTGPSPYTSCGGGQGDYSNPTPESAHWARPGTPPASGCGPFDGGTYSFNITVSVPGGFTGPLTVVVTTHGDGFGAGDPTATTQNIVFGVGGCTLTATCPGDMTAAAPPGASGAAVTFPLPTTGGTCTGATVACTPAPGDFFPVGTTTVACTATASGGTPANCSFDVTVGNQTLQEIPAASALGLGALALLLAGAAFVALRRLG